MHATINGSKLGKQIRSTQIAPTLGSLQQRIIHAPARVSSTSCRPDHCADLHVFVASVCPIVQIFSLDEYQSFSRRARLDCDERDDARRKNFAAPRHWDGRPGSAEPTAR